MDADRAARARLVLGLCPRRQCLCVRVHALELWTQVRGVHVRTSGLRSCARAPHAVVQCSPQNCRRLLQTPVAVRLRRASLFALRGGLAGVSPACARHSCALRLPRSARIDRALAQGVAHAAVL
eukprot:Amastigsp_a177069_19.p5 type:complete len:124 gc:universal Amastigsp_a177069_19:525-896(+)